MTTKLAFFGATGGSAGSCLAAALKAGYGCTALARTPPKLEKALLDRGVDESIISSNLNIVGGDIRNTEAVERVITGADIVVSGIGAYPRFKWSVFKPLVLTDCTICTDAAQAILAPCKSTHTQGGVKKPIFIVISSAGVQEQGKSRALPLHICHVSMEDNIVAHMKLPESQRCIASYVIVKPSILTDGKNQSVDAVRTGNSDNPPIGYSIDRETLGLWMFQRLIKEQGATGVWKDTRVTITY